MTTFFAILLFSLQWQPSTLPDVSLDDLRVFPSRQVAIWGTEATLRYRHEVEKPPLFGSQRECDVWHDWAGLHKLDAYNRWFVWDDLLIATDIGKTDGARLIALQRLRHWLGPQAYYAGQMPSPVPYGWH